MPALASGGAALALALLLVVGGCAVVRQDPSEGVRLPQALAGPREDTPSALRDPDDARLPDPLIEPSQLRRRALPPGGAPPIDRPRFQGTGDVDWLRGDDPVLAVTVGFETRAYPLKILLWHEVVNDTVGGLPVAVTYHPPCNTGLAFHRRVEHRTLSFAASGYHHGGCLLLYDQQTESLWPQLAGRAALGELTGTRLDTQRAVIVAWREFRATYRDSWVLSRDTGHDRPYQRSPYPRQDGPPPRAASPDRRLEPMIRVIALPGLSVAFVRSVVASSAVQPLRFGDRSLVVWHRPGLAAAGGEDIGTVSVFDAEVDGRVLHFRPYGDGFVDDETGTWWTVLGHAVHGPLAGRRLIRQPFLDTYWFVWSGFRPGVQIAL